MDFHFTHEEETFRAEVRSFLDEHMPKSDPPTGEELQQWNHALGEKGWLGFNWPKEYGGYEGTLIEQFILKEETSARRAPPLGSDFMGLTWVGPAIIMHGTADQKKKFLPELLAGESIWCTGYSEPDHGSCPQGQVPAPARRRAAGAAQVRPGRAGSRRGAEDRRSNRPALSPR